MTSKELSHAVIGAAMRVHSHFGPGYLEEVYKNALMVELKSCGIDAEKEVPIAVSYKGFRVGNYQADIIVEQSLILELKAVTALVARHEAQLVNYLTATGIEDGLFINFGASSLQFKHKYRTPIRTE
ncbi:MAG: GxxExxY protein [Kiritimatiellae bacterium]|nr:GxxExxY protein [Kiritimatiellia bacterium]